MKRRFGTSPSNGTADSRRLAWWLLLIGVLIALNYTSRAVSGKPPADSLYEWSTAVGGLIQDAVMLGLVLWITGSARELLALRRPRSLVHAAVLLLGAIVIVYALEGAYDVLVHPGNEQGLTPAHWEPSHAAAYAVNGLVICVWVPIVEELTFRGLGYSLLEPFGTVPAIVGVGLLFGLSHGLVLDLPILAIFGAVLAWLRMKTDSVIPGMVLHATFNLIALVVAVTVNGYIRL